MRLFFLSTCVSLLCGCTAADAGVNKETWPGRAAASAPQGTPGEILNEIFYRSGFSAQIIDLSQLGTIWHKRFQMLLLQHEKEEPSELHHNIVKWSKLCASPAFSEQSLLDVVDNVFRDLGSAALIEVLSFYRSDAWDAFSLFVAQMRNNVGQQKMARALARMRGEKEDPEIRHKRRKLVKLTKEIRMLMLFTWEAAGHYARSLEHILPQHMVESTKERQALRAAFQNNLQDRLELRSKYIFQNLPEPVLDAHLRFFQSEAGQRFTHMREQALSRALAAAEKKATQEIWTAYSKWKKERPAADDEQSTSVEEPQPFSPYQ